MANLRTSEDCFSYMYSQVGDSAGTTRFQAQATQWLNIAHREIVSGNSNLVPNIVANFPWAKSASPKTATLLPSATGTATVTEESTSGTFAVAPSVSLVGYHIIFTGMNALYKISAHTAGDTAFTLDAESVKSLSSVAFTAYKLEYSIGSSDILRVISPFRGYEDNGNENKMIHGEEESSFFRSFPSVSSGEPTHFTILNDDNGTLKVRFNRYPSARRRIDIPYIPIPEDLTNDQDSQPLVPLNHRHSFCNLAVFYYYDIKGDSRADKYFELARNGYTAMLFEMGFRDLDFRPKKTNAELKEERA